MACSSVIRRRRTTPALGAFASIVLVAIPTPAFANPESARRVLQGMSDYLASQPNLSADLEIDLDVITPQVEKIQFSATGRFLLSRPGRVRVVRTGGYTDMELISDGRQITIHDREDHRYARIDAAMNVDQAIDLLRTRYSIDMPGADLLLTNSFAALMDGVIEAKHIGTGIVDGQRCEHLAFRNDDTDWQLWVRTGAQPLPCKYVITSKTMAAAPQYSVRFRNWNVAPTVNDAAFTFVPPANARSVPFEDLTTLGELPAPAPPGGSGGQ
jgi:hypothetical protein